MKLIKFLLLLPFKLLMLIFGKNKSANDSSKEVMYDVVIRGTIQLNGSKPLNHKVRMNQTQLNSFKGYNRKEVMRGWIQANYPGANLKTSHGVVSEYKKVK